MFDIRANPVDEYGEFDGDKVNDYIDGLISEFVDSPEGQASEKEVGENPWAAFFLQYYFEYIDTDLSRLSLADFNQFVYELFPRKVSTEPDTAPEILTELRHFFIFLARQYNLKSATSILAHINDKAVLRLKSALSDPRNFGMAKSFFMHGQSLGFDMANDKEMQEYVALRNLQAGQETFQELDQSFPQGQVNFDMWNDLAGDLFEDESMPGRQTSEPSRDKVRKQRKAQGQAKKKNRRK